MVENYTKDIKESVYHGAVVSALAVGYTMLGKTLIKMSPPSLSKFDTEDGVNNKKRSHTQLDSRKQVIAFQDRVITINIKEAQHPLK